MNKKVDSENITELFNSRRTSVYNNKFLSNIQLKTFKLYEGVKNVQSQNNYIKNNKPLEYIYNS